MRYLTINEVAYRTSLDHQTIRKRFPLTRFGQAVRIWEGEVTRLTDRRTLALIEGDPGLSMALRDYRNAELVLEHLDPDPDTRADPDMAGLLLSSMAAVRMEHPDWPPIGVEAVFAPLLAWLKRKPPQGGGPKGGALRAMLAAA